MLRVLPTQQEVLVIPDLNEPLPSQDSGLRLIRSQYPNPLFVVGRVVFCCTSVSGCNSTTGKGIVLIVLSGFWDRL